MKCSVSALHNSPEFLENVLKTRPQARIIYILSHDQRKGFHQILNDDKTPYLDDFSCPVYVAREIDWEGTLPDIDERFDGTGLLPF